MRILYVLHQFFPQYHSGTEQFVLALARAGRAAGDDVRVFTVDPDFNRREPARELAAFEVHGVPVQRYRFDRDGVRNQVFREYHNPEVGPHFRACLDEFQPEAVHVFHFRWVGIDRFAEVRERRIPCFIHLMDFWFACPNFLLLRPDGENCQGSWDEGLSCLDCVHTHAAEAARSASARQHYAAMAAQGEPAGDQPGEQALGYALQRRPQDLAAVLAAAEGVFAPSRTVRDVLAAAGATSTRTHLMPYGVDDRLLRDLPEPPAGPITFGFMGTLTWHKGLHLLVEAFRQLRGEARLRVHGRFGDNPEFDRHLRQLAGDDPRIEFAQGFDHDRIREVLGGLHAVVVPSTWRENTPFVCLEARVAGVPVIASDLPGMAEAVPAGRGTLFANGQVDDLRRVLQEFCDRGPQARQPDRSIPSIAEAYAALRDHYRG